MEQETIKFTKELVDKILKEGQKRKSADESICSAYVNGVK